MLSPGLAVCEALGEKKGVSTVGGGDTRVDRARVRKTRSGSGVQCTVVRLACVPSGVCMRGWIKEVLGGLTHVTS